MLELTRTMMYEYFYVSRFLLGLNERKQREEKFEKKTITSLDGKCF